MPDSQYHTAVPVKVTAMVDERIAGLVAQLNACDGVVTYSSCQGYEEEPTQQAQIWFEYVGEKPLLEFYGWLATLLKTCVAPHGNYDLRVEWSSHSPAPTAYLFMPPSTIPLIENALLHSPAFGVLQPRIA